MKNAHSPARNALTLSTIADIPGLLETCVDRLNDAVVITEAASATELGQRIVWANRVFYENSGYSPAEVLGQTPRILQGPGTDRATLDRIRTAIETWQSVRAETLNYRKDGTTFWNEFEIVPIANGNGWFTHWVSVQRDITARKQTEEKLMLAASVFTHSREGIMITDAEGSIVDTNAAFTRITGYSREEALGLNPRLLGAGRQDNAYFATMWQHLLDKGHWSGEIWNQRKCGEVYPESLTISAVRDHQQHVLQYVAIFADISERKALEEKLRQFAFFDPLTGLPNRRLLDERFHQSVLASKRSGLYSALMLLDLDNFKQVNDRHGHDAGDLLLIEVTRRLTTGVREVDTVARLGGDEFVVLLSELDANKVVSTHQARGVAEKLLAIVAAPYQLTIVQAGQNNITVEHLCSASIGVALFIDNEFSQKDVMKGADSAMYQAKDAGRNKVQFYANDATRSQTPGGHSTHGLTGNFLHRDNAQQEREALNNTILNSLNAEIAVVDGTGVILAVNDRWQKFALENGFEQGKPAPNTGVGSNYFKVCGPGSDDCTGDILDASTGLQAVLDGRLASFSLDYPCDSPTQQRWFAMVVMPLGQGVRNGAVITHTDITKRKQAEVKLLLAARVFRDAHEGITITNAQGTIIEVNDAFTRITGYSREEVLGHNPRIL